MRNPIDLDEEMRGTSNRDDRETPVPERQPALVLPETLEIDLQISTVPVDLVAVRSDLTDTEFVGLALVAQFDGASDGVAGPWATTPSGGKERRPLTGLLGIVGIDRGGDDRDVGVDGRTGRGARIGTVEPPGVSGSGNDFLFVEEAEQERLGGRAAVDDDGGLA